MYDCYVLSRDRFADYRRIYPSIQRRLVIYNVNGEKLEFKPRLEEIKSRRATLRQPATLSVECSIEQVRRFLFLATRNENAKFCSDDILVERKKKKGHGEIHVEAEFKEVKERRGNSGVSLVKADEVKRLDYRSKSGMTNLTWTPYRLNPSLGRLSGYASPHVIVILIDAGCICIPLPIKEKERRNTLHHSGAHASIVHGNAKRSQGGV